MSVPGLLDHVVIAGPDLAEVVDWLEDLTGVRAAPGGAHPTGTANALVGLTVDGRPGPQYLELIGPDPARGTAPAASAATSSGATASLASQPAGSLPTAFGIDRLERPTLVTYAVHPADLDGTVARARVEGYDPGDVRDLSRRTPDGTLLQWRLTRADDQERFDLPFLIDWGSTPHPGLGDLPRLELLDFYRLEVDPEPLHLLTDALGLGDGVARIDEGTQSRFLLRLRTPDGRVVEL